MLLRVQSEKFFDHSICRTKEQKARLWCLASAMPKPVMPSGAKNDIWQSFYGEKSQESGSVS